MSSRIHLFVPATACLCLAALAVGCGRKKEPIQTPAETNLPPAAASAAPGARTPTAAPDIAVSAAEYSQALARADAARQAREYEQAVQATLALGQGQRTVQQSQAARDQMIKLQSDLAAAAAAGDPKARAALEALRRYSMGR